MQARRPAALKNYSINRFRRKNVYKMKSNFIIFFVVFAFQSVVYGQLDSVQHLEEVYLKSTYLSKGFSGYDVSVIPDSTIEKNRANVLELLQNEFNLYFKQYGNGMLASVSSRGAAASQTTVLWNNVPINSSLNGQVDFNALNLSGISSIQYRKSGSSALLGSGAIAGAINFSNLEQFNLRRVTVTQNLSSYQTYKTVAYANYGTQNQVFTAGIDYHTSENDYIVSKKKFSNTNGQYKKIGFHLGEKISWNKNQWYFRSLFSFNDRNTAASLYAISNAKLKYDTHYLQSGWLHNSNQHQLDVKLTFLKENYDYIYNKYILSNSSINGSQKWYQTLDFQYNFTTDKKLNIGYVLDYTQGIGDNIGSNYIKKAALYSTWHQTLNKKVSYNFGVRKEWSNYFKVPFVFSLDGLLHLNTQNQLLFNVSTNFRSPTLNDLFWYPGGNPNLKPEKSWQTEVGYQNQNRLAEMKTRVFYLQNRDYIQWRPNQSGFWQPVNIQSTLNYGYEIQLSNLKKRSNLFNWNVAYAVTRAQDKSTQYQLMYVPYHVASGRISYQWKKWELGTTGHYNGGVYTTSDQSKVLPGYFVQNVELSRKLLNDKIDLHFEVHNLLNTYYEVIDSYPMPGINFSFKAQIKIQ